MRPTKSATILIVDDQPMVRKSLSLLLAMDGHNAVEAGNAEEALLLFKSRRFDLVITDHEMPGMKGTELTLALKALNPRLPIIMLTAYSHEIAPRGTLPPGIDTLMAKPFSFVQLRAALATLLPQDPDEGLVGLS